MKHIKNWEDLEPYGINELTGEACAAGLRLLCDLTEDGKANAYAFLGIPLDTPVAENWNIGGAASIMMPRSVFKELAAFLLLTGGTRDHGCEIVLAFDHDVVGFTADDLRNQPGVVDEYRETMKHMGHDCRTIMPLRGQPRQGMSSVHAATGRAA